MASRSICWPAIMCDEHLPANAIIFSMQHSGSLWFYAQRPILRWDNVDPRPVG